MAKINGCGLDGMGLIPSTLFSAHRHFQALSGVYLSSDLLAMRGRAVEDGS
jgi:hypothetical protein